MKKKISNSELMTPQEHLVIGSTPSIEPKKDQQWYIPECIISGKLSIEEAIGRRKALGHTKITFNAMLIGLKDTTLCMQFKDLDPKTGQTVDDPKILGIWDNRQNIIVKDPTRNFTKELFGKLSEGGVDLHLRESKNPEGQAGRTEEGPGFRS